MRIQSNAKTASRAWRGLKIIVTSLLSITVTMTEDTAPSPVEEIKITRINSRLIAVCG